MIFVVLLVYSHTGQAENMPDLCGNRTYNRRLVSTSYSNFPFKDSFLSCYRIDANPNKPVKLVVDRTKFQNDYVVGSTLKGS